ncbi:hypothetical protein [Salinactinospora qingdaonensis]|uniref:Uncharacterized protein n=1 Tax=Salinactinospora qingdaonensis TaxID=702744 RepID=A0ABP7FFQ0_9ACTN
MGKPAVTPTVDELASMTDQELKAHISDHLGEENTELWEHLTGPRLYNRTRAILVGLLRSVELHANTERAALDKLQAECLAEGPAARGRFFRARSEYEARKRSRNGFKRLVERRMQQLKAAKRNNHELNQALNHDRHRFALSELALAVYAHRDTMIRDQITPDEHDLRLWEALSSITVEVGGRTVTLGEAIEYGYWSEPKPAADNSGNS